MVIGEGILVTRETQSGKNLIVYGKDLLMSGEILHGKDLMSTSLVLLNGMWYAQTVISMYI